MKNYFNIANIYILMFCIYMLQGVLIPVGSFISRTIFVVILLITLYYTYVYISTYKSNKYFRGMNVLLVMFVVYGVILLLFGQTVNGLKGVPRYTYLQYTMMSFLPIYPFYVFSKRDLINKKTLSFWIVFFALVVTLGYNNLRNDILSEMDWEETINNMGYVVLVLLPLICLFESKKLFQYVLWGYCLFLIIGSFKRGAILLGGICFIVFLFYSFRSTKGFKKYFVILISVAIVVIGYYYIVNLFENSDLFNRRFEGSLEGDSSGRDSLYRSFWRIFSTETNPIRFLIGYGANGTLALVGEYAHNDWLELAINNGLLGIILYLNYWICFVKFWRSNNHVPPTIRFILGMSLFIAFAKTLFSMSYSNTPFYATLTIGYCLAQYDNSQTITLGNISN